MATKTAQIIIDVDDKSLVELNSEIKTLETSIGKLKVGTAEWQKQNKQLGTLKSQYQAATREAVKMQAVVEKISGAEQLRSVAKLGAGMVGSFAAVNGTLKMIGVNSEAFDEMTAKATTLMSIMGGLNQISEMFSVQNMKGLKAVGAGFKGLVTTVKGASLGMKTALISTGIGALVVGVGLLIANFDKIKNLLSGASKEQKKLAEDAYKSAQQQAKLSQENYNTEQKRIEIYKSRAELFGQIQELAQAEYEMAQAKTKQINDQIVEENAYIETLLVEYDKAKKARQIEINDLLQISKAKKQGLLHELSMSFVAENNAKLYTKVAVEIDKINDKIKDNQNRLTVLNVQNNKQREIYQKQLDILNEQIEVIQKSAKYVNAAGKDTTKLTKEQQDQVDALNAQISAMKIQETERQKQLTIEFNLLAAQRDEILTLTEITNKYREIRDGLLKESGEIKNANKGYEDRVKLFEKQKKDYDELVKKKQALINFDERGEGLLYQQNKDLEDQLLNMNELFAKSAAMINIQLEGKQYNEDKIDAAAKELTFFKQIADAQIEKLKNDELGLENRKKDLLTQKAELQELNGIAEIKKRSVEFDIANLKTDFAKAKTDEERKAILEKVVEQEDKLAGINQQIADNKTEILNVDTDIVATNNDILTVTQDIDATAQSVLDKNKELADTIEQQSRGYQGLQDWMKKYQEEINVSRDVLMQSMEMMAAFQDRRAKKAQEAIDDWSDKLDKLKDEENDRKDKLDEYNDLLKDANGERYDEIMALKDAETQKIAENLSEQTKANDEIKKQELEKAKAERKAAAWRKAQAIVDAIIQGALGVIKALPNVFLAVATGVLAAAGVATIAAQKLPPLPESKEVGGFTRKTASNSEPVGIVHGNEYVAPAFVVNSASGQQHIQALEAQRLRGFADGGFVPPNVNGGSNSMIDYDMMTASFLSAVQSLPNPQVSLVKIGSGLNEVQLTKTNAGLSR